MRLTGKTALITGAGQGVGKGIAKVFAHEGAQVVLADWKEDLLATAATEIQRDGGVAYPVRCDVTQAADVEQAVDSGVQTYGRIDILVTSAIRHYHDNILETSEEDWDQTIAVGLKGVFLNCKAVIPHMIRQGGGTIINIGSGNQMLASTHMAAYTAAKGGAWTLTRQLAIEYGPKNIRCNCICPGGVLTETVRAKFSPEDEHHNNRCYPLGRMAMTDDIAYAAVYLASDEAAYITGINLPVDGGLSALCAANAIVPEMLKLWDRDIDKQ